jgi:hypothetical protein
MPFTLHEGSSPEWAETRHPDSSKTDLSGFRQIADDMPRRQNALDLSQLNESAGASNIRLLTLVSELQKADSGIVDLVRERIVNLDFDFIHGSAFLAGLRRLEAPRRSRLALYVGLTLAAQEVVWSI